jgi:hypothetical protein
MYISQLDAEHHYRIYCRPIHTSFGPITMRPISPGYGDLTLSGVASLEAGRALSQKARHAVTPTEPLRRLHWSSQTYGRARDCHEADGDA